MGTLHQRETFFVGGSYTQGDDGTHRLSGQMYVEHLSPSRAVETKPFPLVFIHGATRSGNDWITKPDGKPGWASFFLSQGYELYLIDQPFRGRSAWPPGHSTIIAYTAEQIQQVFTACKQYEIWPQAALHTQWPGTGVMGDPVFDQLFASTLQMVGDTDLQERATQTACAALLDRINRPVILIGHSQGGSSPLLVADVRPSQVKMIVTIEPVGPPFSKASFIKGPGARYGVSFAPITYDPPVTNPDTDFVQTVLKADSPSHVDCLQQAQDPPPRQLINLKGIPVLLMTAQASYHAQYDWAVVRYLQQAGVEAEHLELQDVGIFGNGHMMFLEKNSDEIAAALEGRMNEILKRRSLA
ncbi:hypothetical protein G7054_g4549 [Neopestalotiopsis clavispora]|nr:hypothetical protein G7054_g4549 [Neopestalotiopsis clavispora]